MSGATSGPSQPWTSRVGSYYFCIGGLPRGFTWQDLKDLIRREASHGIWAEMYRHPDGITGEIGYVRVQRLEEANNLYTYLVSRGLQVHFFDTSKAVPERIRCTCPNGLCTAIQRSQQLVTINHIAASPTLWQPLGSPNTHPRPPVTYLGVPVMHYTPTTATAPMDVNASYSMQDLETSMADARLDDRQSEHPLQLICRALASPNPAAQGAGRDKLSIYLEMLTSDQRATAIAFVQSQLPAYQARAPAAQVSYTYGPDGTPVNSSRGVIITEATSVFVSKLDYKATVKDIEKRFSKGELRPMKCVLQKDQATGRSRGHAIVQYANAKDARKAVTMFDKQKFMGMEISVRLDKEKVAVNPPQSSHASSSNGRSGRSSGSNASGSNRAAAAAAAAAAVQSRMNADPIIANGSSVKS